MTNTKRQLLKKKLLSSIKDTEIDIATYKAIMQMPNADIMTYHTILRGLQQRLEILTELNHICVERNRY